MCLTSEEKGVTHKVHLLERNFINNEFDLGGRKNILLTLEQQWDSHNNLTADWGLKDKRLKIKSNNVFRNFPGGPLVKTLPANAGDTGLNPGWGAKIRQALWPKNQNIKNRSNIVTNSRKTLKWSTLKIKKKKKKKTTQRNQNKPNNLSIYKTIKCYCQHFRAQKNTWKQRYLNHILPSSAEVGNLWKHMY